MKNIYIINQAHVICLVFKAVIEGNISKTLENTDTSVKKIYKQTKHATSAKRLRHPGANLHLYRETKNSLMS